MTAEARNLSEELFKLVDQDSSGKISEAEFAAAVAVIAGASALLFPHGFAGIDANADGEVDRAEWDDRMLGQVRALGPGTFVAECLGSLRAVRDAYGDGARLHPWIDLDFRSLGQERRVIDGADRRGITVPQLKKLRGFLANHAGEGGLLQGWWDRFTGKPLHLATITLYAVADWVVKPSTAKEACSFVELLVDEGTAEQPPQWFISHWWGEPVCDFIKAVERHAAARGLEDTAAYWVCAYALISSLIVCKSGELERKEIWQEPWWSPQILVEIVLRS